MGVRKLWKSTEIRVNKTGEGLRNPELMLQITCALQHLDQGSVTLECSLDADPEMFLVDPNQLQKLIEKLQFNDSGFPITNHYQFL